MHRGRQSRGCSIVLYSFATTQNDCTFLVSEIEVGKSSHQVILSFGAICEKNLEAHKPEARDTKLDGIWAMSIEGHRDDVLLCHPSYRPRQGESKLVYKSPIVHISTSA